MYELKLTDTPTVAANKSSRSNEASQTHPGKRNNRHTRYGLPALSPPRGVVWDQNTVSDAKGSTRIVCTVHYYRMS